MRAQVVACIILASITLAGSLSEPADNQQEEYDHVLATTITVDSTNLRFSPSDVTISEGETVNSYGARSYFRTMPWRAKGYSTPVNHPGTSTIFSHSRLG